MGARRVRELLVGRLGKARVGRLGLVEVVLLDPVPVLLVVVFGLVAELVPGTLIGQSALPL